MAQKYLTAGEERIMKYLDSLIVQGESLFNVKEHPGKTTELNEWKEKVDTLVIRTFGGKNSFHWGQIARTIIIPRWFNPEIHGKIETPGTVFTDAQYSDRKNALRIYKEGIGRLVSILKSLKDDVDINGLPSEPKQQPFTGSIFTTNISPHFSQKQTQSQEQKLNIELSLEEARRVVEEVVESSEDLKMANKVLDELEEEAKEAKPKWSTAKKAADMFLKFGRDAFISLLPVLLQVYGIVPPTPTKTS